MRRLIKQAAWIALTLPAFALAASTAQRELAEVLKSKPDLTHGAELFGQCTGCHQTDGGGVSNGSTPRIAGQHFRVLAKQLVDFRYGKRWDFRMEGMADKHHLPNAQDIADVAAYIGNLDQSGKRGIGSGGFVEDGRRIYAGECQSCHGADAQGTDDGVPRLAGQHYAYLMRQMYDAVDGRRPALSRLHGKRIAPLDFEQIRAVADYLARIGWDGGDSTPTSAPQPLPTPN
jgi:cytochrome c553